MKYPVKSNHICSSASFTPLRRAGQIALLYTPVIGSVYSKLQADENPLQLIFHIMRQCKGDDLNVKQQRLLWPQYILKPRKFLQDGVICLLLFLNHPGLLPDNPPFKKGDRRTFPLQQCSFLFLYWIYNSVIPSSLQRIYLIVVCSFKFTFAAGFEK